ncbi:MAG: MerR family transcriptional regulator [Dysgonamonadaceae bacterium]|jgi:DNA-binding transcriptional MerR regulator|nr:MerR family transcriptional regulator [Dysgonamonadaceae bacterium]
MEKVYYSIAEVAKMFNVNPSALRYWEKQGFLKLRRTDKGTRQYNKSDIETVRIVCHLINEKGMTLDGVKRELSANKKTVATTVDVINRLQAVRDELQALKKAFDSI